VLNQKVLLFFSLLGGITAGLVFALLFNPPFKSLNSGQMLEKVKAQQVLGIKKAQEEGSYRCCIKPACTMCYLEANQWNNHQPGTCACDDLIAQGKEPCPQCKQGFCEADKAQESCQ